IITLVTRSLNHAAAGENGNAEPQLQIEVRDDGVGMDEKTRQRCLEPFFSTKAQRGGTGLGLAMVYGMTQRHDGNIEIDSTPGRGTCIRLTLPIKRKTRQTSRAKLPQSRQKRSLNILCIDDDEKVRLLLNDCLAHFNHRVMVASGGKDGVELFR